MDGKHPWPAIFWKNIKCSDIHTISITLSSYTLQLKQQNYGKLLKAEVKRFPGKQTHTKVFRSVLPFSNKGLEQDLMKAC